MIGEVRYAKMIVMDLCDYYVEKWTHSALHSKIVLTLLHLLALKHDSHSANKDNYIIKKNISKKQLEKLSGNIKQFDKFSEVIQK
jgi:hypothetical protein